MLLAKGIRLHSHPNLEKNLFVPEGHVIIDADAYLWLLNFHCENISKGEIKDGKF